MRFANTAGQRILRLGNGDQMNLLKVTDRFGFLPAQVADCKIGNVGVACQRFQHPVGGKFNPRQVFFVAAKQRWQIPDNTGTFRGRNYGTRYAKANRESRASTRRCYPEHGSSRKDADRPVAGEASFFIFLPVF